MFAAYAACGFICILARPPAQSSATSKGEGREHQGKAPFPFFLVHLASAALRAISWRRSGGIRSLRTFAEAIPPLRPKTTA